MIKHIGNLKKIMATPSPSGHEETLQALLHTIYKNKDITHNHDKMGNHYYQLTTYSATTPRVMMAAHSDEIGLMITYIDDRGFLYFDPIGGLDIALLSGQQVSILTNHKKKINGVIGKKAIHHIAPKDHDKIGEKEEYFIDIGESNVKKIKSKISIGDVCVINTKLIALNKQTLVGRGFDDKIGIFVMFEVLRKINAKKTRINLTAVSTVQEELGLRGGKVGAYNVNPDIALVIDVGFATDFPGNDKRKAGEFYLGKGPIINVGPNMDKLLTLRLEKIAKKNNIPYQLRALAKGSGTDANVIQTNGKGTTTLLLSIPLRYMHSPIEMVNVRDIKQSIHLLTLFIKDLAKQTKGK